ncbi:MAG: hypothetical protein QG588_2013 [Candidatus Poribacteria bacterium]|nr:hypothetical protein [Candidatus Poribacteria bacterium]
MSKKVIMRQNLICNFIVINVFISLLATVGSVSASYFQDTGLLDIPTAYVMDNGIFNAGVKTSIRHETREEIFSRIDFGLLNFAELGVVGIRLDDKDYLMCNAKILLARESGVLPEFAIGMDNLGEKIPQNICEYVPTYDLSFYAVISKQFNLPFIHIIRGHLGIGNKRYIYDESIGKYLHGAFLGLGKELVLTSRNICLSLMGEIKGNDVNAGLKYTMNSGLIVNFAAQGLNSKAKNIIYHIGIGFTNAPMMMDIAQSIELAKQAVRIANEARSESNEK